MPCGLVKVCAPEQQHLRQLGLASLEVLVGWQVQRADARVRHRQG
eukprot:CAMPEP_0171115236 /NCGR_PEP_ID=MMETSP0766_2-20121228/87290_1 /TAXON_ID=439317 /ORGANISM="Gambierdiscus australes, Strain CAWD 149" /LENGTH=44 /DNA_ID= /DNA_START= /DNA_END= /DNA_ORIENTATION=